MDYDRRSAVSSFYGARKSTDVLDASTSSPSLDPTRRPRADSAAASSFYNPNRMSRAGTDYMGGTPNAGYNRSSFFVAGREEPLKGGTDEAQSMLSKPADDAFNIYADFNNAGPRYSTAFGQDTGYRQVPSPVPHASVVEDEPFTPKDVELVTVPALGPEWKKSEMRDMRSSAKREKRVESFRECFGAWNRGERGCCGPYFTKRTTTYVVFALCIAVGIILAFTIPRVPDMDFPSANPLSNATGSFSDSVPTIFSRSPANFSFPANLNLEFNTGSNFLPIHFTKMVQQFGLDDGATGRDGDLGSTTLPAKAFPPSTCRSTSRADFYNGCRNPGLNANGTRPFLQFNFDLDMYIFGLVGKRSTSAPVTQAECPVTLSVTHA
ncbi:uncharacterized protein B0H18DRAFT_1120642 [Fomitopsis serialis]|uniref:uncharacterized protein n=1 Tax=Fomitopsis serialis TaxID=139415 RepID=UPI002007E4C0|nr:uncharacterized protein B0H18DRAFT_1120642 [Neoantrodia serialis]KAH9922922.1 hypothetical protein B0H18DRAFT_1120642 [Neoantrodia serialis]